MTWTLLTWLKDLRTFFLHDSKTSTFCEPSCEHDSRIWASFYMTQRIELFFLEYDSKNWTFSGIWLNGLFFEKINSNNWTLFYVTHRIEPFPNMTHRIEPFPNMTHRIEPFLNMTHRIEPFLYNMTQRIEPFAKYVFFWKKMTHRIESFLETTTHIIFLKKYDSQNWTFLETTTQRIEPLFNMTQKNWIWGSMTHWIEHFLNDMTQKNWTLFFNMTQRIEPSFSIWDRFEPLFSWLWLADLNLSFLVYDSQIWTSLFLIMTRRFEPLFSWIWLTELNFSFLEYQRIEPLSQMTQRIEPLSPYDSKNWPLSPNQRIEPSSQKNTTHFFECGSKNWTLVECDSKNWTLSSTWLRELNPWVKYDSKNWTVLSKFWLKELNLLHKRIQTIEPFKKHES